MKLAVADGITDIDTVQQQVEMSERKKYLESHKYKIWQGSNGFWYTYLEGRKLIKRKNKRDLENIVISENMNNEMAKMAGMSEIFSNTEYQLIMANIFN